MFGLPAIHECVPDGGVFALVIPPIAGVLLAIEVLWLLVIGTRELKRRSDLLRVRDLLIEGSIGQAILLSDRRQKDDVLAVCRAGIVAVQGAAGGRELASDRIAEAASRRFGASWGMRFKLLLLLLMALVPVGLAFTGRAYAERLAVEAAAELPEALRASAIAEVRGDPPFACPFTLGFAGALLLAFPAVLIGFLEANTRSASRRRAAITQAEMFADMAAVVVGSDHHAYRDDRR